MWIKFLWIWPWPWPMTLIFKLDLDIAKRYVCIKNEASILNGSKVIAWTNRHTDRRTDRQTDRQTDGQTDSSENITYPHTRMVTITNWYNNKSVHKTQRQENEMSNDWQIQSYQTKAQNSIAVSRKPQYKDVYRRTIEMPQRARTFKVNCCLKFNVHLKLLSSILG